MEKLKSLSQEHCSKMDALEEACQVLTCANSRQEVLSSSETEGFVLKAKSL